LREGDWRVCRRAWGGGSDGRTGIRGAMEMVAMVVSCRWLQRGRPSVAWGDVRGGCSRGLGACRWSHWSASCSRVGRGDVRTPHPAVPLGRGVLGRRRRGGCRVPLRTWGVEASRGGGAVGGARGAYIGRVSVDPLRSGCGRRQPIGQLSWSGPSRKRIRRLPRIPRSGKSDRFALRESCLPR